MSLYKIRGYSITNFDGYVEANSLYDARKKAEHDRQWETKTTSPISHINIDYIYEIENAVSENV